MPGVGYSVFSFKLVKLTTEREREREKERGGREGGRLQQLNRVSGRCAADSVCSAAGRHSAAALQHCSVLLSSLYEICGVREAFARFLQNSRFYSMTQGPKSTSI